MRIDAFVRKEEADREISLTAQSIGSSVCLCAFISVPSTHYIRSLVYKKEVSFLTSLFFIVHGSW